MHLVRGSVAFKGVSSVHLGIVGYNLKYWWGLPRPKQLSVVAPMRGWYRCVHACGDRHPKGLVWGRVQLTVHNAFFCVQIWSLTKFYRLNGSQIANLTLDSKLTPVLCHHWQVGDVGCGHGVWTPVMKIHGDKVWKKNLFFLFLAEFLLKSEVLW